MLLKQTKQSGFALVIALSLMAFVLLLLLSITTLVQVETQSAQIHSSRIKAEHNALLGLEVALGELQKAAGPDRRVSARSEILSPSPSYPRILGVYNIDPSVILPSTSSPEQYFEDLRVGARNRVKWLVSVEDAEGSPLTDPNTQTPEALSNSTVAMQSYRAADGSAAQVRAGQVPLEDSGDSFAWWVDEENLKAKFNVTAPERTDLGIPFEDEWSLGTAQFANFFKVDTNLASGSYAPKDIESYDPTSDRSDLAKLVSPEQVDQSFAVTDLPNWFKEGIFDYTLHSFGLPVDVTHGRLKQDLSAYLNTGGGLNDSDPIIRGDGADTNFEGPPLANIRYADADMPRFGLLKSWKQIGSTVTGFDNGGIASRPHTDSEHGIHPVIARAGYSYSNIFVDAGVSRGRTRSLDLKVVISPRVTLWNPTSVPITDSHYIFQIGLVDNMYLFAGANEDRGQAAVIDNYGNGYKAGAWGGNLNIAQWNFRDQFGEDHSLMIGNNSFTPSFTFTLKLDTPLLPGQTRTFYPQATAVELQRYDDVRFDAITPATAEDGNVLVNRPNVNHYYTIPGGSGTSTVKYTSTSGAPPVPDYVEAYTRLKHVDVGGTPNAWGGSGAILGGAYYRLFNVSHSAEPALLQEFVSIEDSGTGEYPQYTSLNANYYDDPGDGVDATGFTLQRFSTVPEFSLGRGHQIFLSYAQEDPSSDYGSIFADGSRQFSMFSHYNPRSRHVFPGTFEETNAATQSLNANDFDSARHGIRQSVYSEGRPEKAWLNEWSADIESGYGSGSDFGSPILYDLNDSSNGLIYPLYDFPRAADGVLSLGSLQSVNFASYPWQPGHAFGNSRATPRIAREQVVSSDFDTARDHPYIQELSLGENRYIDLSWLLNFSMWDRFFVSTLDYGGAFASTKDTVLKNSRHLITDYEGGQTGDLISSDSAVAFADAAANILVNGAFNVNSTSVSAWKQFLSSQMNLQVPVTNVAGGADSTPADQAAFSRMLYPYRAEQPAGDRGVDGNFNSLRAAFAANRSLTDEELQALAERIVEEVRLRGPFISLANFVNRRLVDENDATYGAWAGLSGVLQTAIDAVTRDQSLINDHLFDDSDLRFKRSDVPSYLEQAHVLGLPDSGDSQSRLMDAPGALTQADILSSHGALMTVRGDTFRIRSYGKSTVGIAGGEFAEAWCEAIVQRTAIPVAAGDDMIHPDESTFPFGRQFQVISIRWLAEDEI
jgi:hypothetical protein